MFNIKQHLYRAKRVTDNKWEIGFLVKYAQGYAIHPMHDTSLVIYVQEDTIGQCSGLRDKNGIWIYEGDVLSGDSSYASYYGLISVVRCGTFEDEDTKNSIASSILKDLPSAVFYGWYLECIKSGLYRKVGDTDGIEPTRISKFEIIGNIYDNPDMIQQS